MADGGDDSKPEPIVIAVVRDYAELLAALRERVDALNVPRSQIDEIAGLPAGYAGKLLGEGRFRMARQPTKTLGWASMGPFLGALGLSLQIVIDPEATRRHTERMTERNAKQVRIRAKASIGPPPWLFTSETGRKAAEKRAMRLTPAQRRRIAKRAIRARWKRHRASMVP